MASGKILIVDDDTNICELLRLYIEKEGFEASIANDGETALKMFDTVGPDLILLDIMLPGLDGWQVCREIRKKSSCPSSCSPPRVRCSTRCWGWNWGPTTMW